MGGLLPYSLDSLKATLMTHLTKFLQAMIIVAVLGVLFPFTAFAQDIADCDETPNGQGGQDIVCDGYHEGVVNGTAGNDTITNEGTLDGYLWGGGYGTDPNQNDTLINNGTVGDGEVNPYTNLDDDGIWGSTGDDIIINNGTVNGGLVGAIFGDDSLGTGSDDDTIIHNGTANGDINGDFSAQGNDTITINGTVNGGVYGDAAPMLVPYGGTTGGGNDEIILQNNAVVTGGIFGGAGFDILTFAFEILDFLLYNAVINTISTANPASGSLDYNGNIFQWWGFEQIQNNVVFIGTPPPEPTEEVTPEPTSEVTPEPTQEVTPEPTQEVTPEPTSEVTPEPTSEVTPEPTSEVTPEPTSEVTPEPTQEVTPEPTQEVTPEPTQEVPPEPTSEVTPEPTQEVTPEPTSEVTPEPTSEVTPVAPIYTLTPTPLPIAPEIKDGRLNRYDLAAPAAVYCNAGGVLVIDINEIGRGGAAFQVSGGQITVGLAQAITSGQNVLLAQNDEHSLWALTTNELQMHSPNYDFIFDGGRCAA